MYHFLPILFTLREKDTHRKIIIICNKSINIIHKLLKSRIIILSLKKNHTNYPLWQIHDDFSTRVGEYEKFCGFLKNREIIENYSFQDSLRWINSSNSFISIWSQSTWIRQDELLLFARQRRKEQSLIIWARLFDKLKKLELLKYDFLFVLIF